MKQKEVKIVGLKLNSKLGILESCHLEFNEKNRLISVKGEVGAGKTTLQKSLMLGTLGVDTLKHDKSLYGEINQEVQLSDGDNSLFVGCKSSEHGVEFVIFTKGEDGKKIKNPIIDGVKLTPASYLKDLQTKLTWRLDELTNDNPTVQKKLLLELYKSQLGDLGVIFDKKNDKYVDSILHRLEVAENTRSEKEFLRKQVGGLATQLQPLGIDVNDESTWPKYNSKTDLVNKISKLEFEEGNLSQKHDLKLSELKNKANSTTNELKSLNQKLEASNKVFLANHTVLKEKHLSSVNKFTDVLTKLGELVNEGKFTSEYIDSVEFDLNNKFNWTQIPDVSLNTLLDINDKGVITTNASEWTGSEEISGLLSELNETRSSYKSLLNKPITSNKEEIDLLKRELNLLEANNHRYKMLQSFLDWQDSNNEVVRLKKEYSNLLASVNTGVSGLKISVSEKEIYLTYNGEYDTKYFSNENKVDRKLSSYSGTQKPVICLLLQSYLLSIKPKALRYLWIDNVPIDNKTKVLLEHLGQELNVTIIVNITGDFEEQELQDGEVLLKGGEIFFNKL